MISEGLETRFRVIRAILQKDLLDAFRDSRILGILLAPVLIGLLYSFVMQDEAPQAQAKVGVVAASTTQLPRAMRSVSSDNVKLTFREVTGEQALRRLVSSGDLDIGLVVPPDFDRRAQEGGSPTLRVLTTPSPSFGGEYVAALLERSVQSLTGTTPLFHMRTVSVRGERDDLFVMNQLGPRRFMILWAVVFLALMIAVYALPTILAEEMQTRTLDSLLLIASYGDVVIAKALFGLVSTAVGAPLLLVITRVEVAAMPLFAAALALGSLCLVGIGLLLGSFLSNPNQLSTWGSFVSLPLAGGSIAMGLGLPPTAETVLLFLPTAHLTRLLSNTVAGSSVYTSTWMSWTILSGWTVVIYALVWWRLRRLEL